MYLSNIDLPSPSKDERDWEKQSTFSGGKNLKTEICWDFFLRYDKKSVVEEDCKGVEGNLNCVKQGPNPKRWAQETFLTL